MAIFLPYLFMLLIAIPGSISVVASSDSFTVQHFIDAPGGLLPSEGRLHQNCTKDNLPIPDIVGVSYSSDGEYLNNTIWLRQPFIDPSRTNVTIYKIDITNENQMNSFKHPHISIQNNTIVGENAELRNTTKNSVIVSNLYDYESEGGRGILMIIDTHSSVSYIVTFDTESKFFFDFYWSKAERIFDSLFKLLSNGTAISHARIDQISRPDWYVSKTNSSSAFDKLIPYDPLWLRVKYAMTIQVISSPAFGKADSDYKASLDWSDKTNKWTYVLEQISGYQIPQIEQQNKVVIERVVNTPQFSNTAGKGSHLDLALNLDAIESPENYAVITNVYSEFLRPGKNGDEPLFCNVVDHTNWVPLPPPKIDLLASPGSLTLSPGEEHEIQVRANSSASVPATILFNPSSNSSLNLNYTPSTVSLSPFGKGSSTLRVSVPSNSSTNSDGVREVPVDIIGTVRFPIGFILPSTNEAHKSTQTENISTTAIVYVTLLTEGERSMKQIMETFNFASSSIKEFSGVVAAMVTIISPLTVILGTKYLAKRTKMTEKVTVDQMGYFSYFVAAPLAIAGILHLLVPTLLTSSGTNAVFFLFFGLFQIIWTVPVIIGWKICYYIGIIVTVLFIILGFIGSAD